MKYRAISADNHVMEPPGTFVDRVDAKYRDRAPRVLPVESGGEGWTLDGKAPRSSFSKDDSRKGGAMFSEIPKGSWDGAAHVKAMAEDGLDAGVVYPGISKSVLDYEDLEFSLACLKAYNDWLIEDFQSADTSRLVGVALVPVNHDAPVMVAEIERMLKKGAKAFYFPFYPPRPLYDPHYDPVWKVISEAGAVASIHNFVANVGTVPPKPVPGVTASQLMAGQATVSILAAPIPVTYMMFTGVFERFPTLKFVVAEVNLGWAPAWIQQMRHTIDTPRRKGFDWWGELPTDRPEDYIGKNVFFTILDDALGFQFAQEDERLGRAAMYSTDYPHPISMWPRSPQILPELTKGMDETTKHNVLAGNAVRVFNLA